MLALVCVGAFTGRGHAYFGGGPGSSPNPFMPSFRRPEVDVDTWGRVVREVLLYVQAVRGRRLDLDGSNRF